MELSQDPNKNAPQGAEDAATPANAGHIYENKSGARLARNGNDVMWNTAARTAAESCRVVYTPL